MRTYWLGGEDPTQRLARIREEMLHGSSLFSSISSERKDWWCFNQIYFLIFIDGILGLSETPDLLRRPVSNKISLGGVQRLPSASQSECPLLQLHERARLACSVNSSQVFSKLYEKIKKLKKNEQIKKK